MFGLSKTISRIAIAAVAVILVLGFLQVRSCQQAAQRAAQSKMDRGQAGAARESAADAVNTVSGVAENQAASEDVTRSNRDDILKAEGADDRVNPAVRDAGLRALCRRKAAANDPKCRVRGTIAE